MPVYTLKKHTRTKELHLFEAKSSSGGSCVPESKSICKKMELSDSEGNKFSCQNEEYTRKKCAEYGREVCGTCVSHLYGDF